MVSFIKRVKNSVDSVKEKVKDVVEKSADIFSDTVDVGKEMAKKGWDMTKDITKKLFHDKEEAALDENVHIDLIKDPLEEVKAIKEDFSRLSDEAEAFLDSAPEELEGSELYGRWQALSKELGEGVDKANSIISKIEKGVEAFSETSSEILSDKLEEFHTEIEPELDDLITILYQSQSLDCDGYDSIEEMPSISDVPSSLPDM